MTTLNSFQDLASFNIKKSAGLVNPVRVKLTADNFELYTISGVHNKLIKMASDVGFRDTIPNLNSGKSGYIYRLSNWIKRLNQVSKDYIFANPKEKIESITFGF